MDNNTFIKMYGEYLRDESRLVGNAESIVFPKSEAEIISSVKEMSRKNIQITTQGARTGLAASAVPYKGHIINLSKMNKVTGARYDEKMDRFFITVQPGVLLSELRKYISNKSFNANDWDEQSVNALKYMEKNQWFYSTDPTETSASMGGIASCNASGAKSYRYGSARDHITGLRVVLADGDVLDIKRGQYIAGGDSKFRLVTEGGREIKGQLPKYKMPDVKKNTSGYYNMPEMDMIDLFIGSDGTLGIISEIEVELNKAQKADWGATIFMPDEDKSVDLVRAIRHEITVDNINLKLNPSAIEFFSHNALCMLREQQKTNAAFSNIQEIKESYHTAVYIEVESDSDDVVWTEIEKLGDVINGLGGDEDDSWVAYNPANLEKLHYFRHACPECVNMQIDNIKKTDSRITKLGTDMSVPDNKLKAAMKMYNEGIGENHLTAVIFGHIGNNHLHVNIIPQNMYEYEKGKSLFLIWAEKIAAMGGAVSAEHGVGKLKVPFLKKMYNEEELNEMRKLKKLFDPAQIFNRGTIFEFEEDGK